MILNLQLHRRIRTKTLALVCSRILVFLVCKSRFAMQSLKLKWSSAWCVKTIYFWSVRGPEVSCLDRLRKEEEKRLAEEERLRRCRGGEEACGGEEERRGGAGLYSRGGETTNGAGGGAKTGWATERGELTVPLHRNPNRAALFE